MIQGTMELEVLIKKDMAKCVFGSIIINRIISVRIISYLVSISFIYGSIVLKICFVFKPTKSSSYSTSERSWSKYEYMKRYNKKRKIRNTYNKIRELVAGLKFSSKYPYTLMQILLHLKKKRFQGQESYFDCQKKM